MCKARINIVNWRDHGADESYCRKRFFADGEEGSVIDDLSAEHGYGPDDDLEVREKDNAGYYINDELMFSDGDTITTTDGRKFVIKFEEVKSTPDPGTKDDTSPGAEAYRETATRMYGRDGSVEIDSDAVVSYGSDPGAYVQAWVWVPAQDAGVCCGCHELSDNLSDEDEDGESGLCEACAGGPLCRECMERINDLDGQDGLCASCADKTESDE